MVWYESERVCVLVVLSLLCWLCVLAVACCCLFVLLSFNAQPKGSFRSAACSTTASN